MSTKAQIVLEVQKDQPAQVSHLGVGGKAPQGSYTVPAAATDAATTQALVNALRAALVANGICV